MLDVGARFLSNSSRCASTADLPYMGEGADGIYKALNEVPRVRAKTHRTRLTSR